MKIAPTQDPNELLRVLVASESEVIRSRDSELAAALDIPPPPLHHELRPIARPQPAPPPKLSLSRRVLRKSYRILSRMRPLQPMLGHVRSQILSRLESRDDSGEADQVGSITRSFTIAFTVRSGSNEICKLLMRNGLGCPGEYFQTPLPGGGGRLILDSFSRIVNQYQVGGVFGCKMTSEHRATLDDELRNAIPGYTRLDDLLPNHRWVFLTRRDKVLQAISWSRAESTNRWVANDPSQGRKRTYTYDFLHILSRLMMIYANEFAWNSYFQVQQIKPLKIVYEEFFLNLDRELTQLIEYLGGLPSESNTIDKQSTLQIQRDEQSYGLRARFISDLNRLGSTRLAIELGEPYQKWNRFFIERSWNA